MARLRNRIRKADFWSDGDLLRWPRDKRTTYSGLWAVADDSGCLEDDPFTWKLLLWPGPLDGDITMEVLAVWRDELTAEGKLIPYEAEGCSCLYIRAFRQHERLRNPQRPEVPLPPWVSWVIDSGNEHFQRGHYDVDTDAIPAGSGQLLLSGNGHGTANGIGFTIEHATGMATGSAIGPPQPNLTKPNPTQHKSIGRKGASYPPEFDEWWDTYGHFGTKADAYTLWVWWVDQGATHDELLRAAEVYNRTCESTDCIHKHARTFLAKDPCRWREYADGEHHGDPRPSANADREHEASVNSVIGHVLKEKSERFGSLPGLAAGGSPAPARSLPPAELQQGE
jgi:hypothetical protein